MNATDKKQHIYLRSVILNEAVTIGLVYLCIRRHPKPSYHTMLTKDPAYKILQFLILLWGNNRQIIHNNNVRKSQFKLWKVFILKYLLIIAANYNWTA